MSGVFDEEEDERAKPQRDTELTLSTGMQVLLVAGLLLVCGLCFGLGYAVGHHGSQLVTAADQQPAAGTGVPLQSSGSLSKPTAKVQPAAPPSVSSATPQNNGSPAAGSVPQPAPAAVVPVAAQPVLNPPASQPQVRPALPPANYAPSAAPSASQLMVQIAAVSHQEDADVLVGALRKRGYAVSARRDPVDSLIHVRIGPFNSRDEANRWRMKLLDDGYNAMIQP
jgi:cell division septation protein DedD